MRQTVWATIDPGVVGTGYALWRGERRKIVRPFGHGIITPPTAARASIEERGSYLFYAILRILIKQGVDELYIEWPEFFGTTGKGHTAAVRGDLSKLIMAASCCASAGWQQLCDVHFVPVTMWKGQLPKEVVARRVERDLQCQKNEYPSHSMDAVALGLWLKKSLFVEPKSGQR